MNDEENYVDLDVHQDFAQKPEEQALNSAWNAMSEAMLQAMTAISVGADEDGKLSVIADSLEPGMESLKQAENFLGLSFIPKPKRRDSVSIEKPEMGQDRVPF